MEEIYDYIIGELEKSWPPTNVTLRDSNTDPSFKIAECYINNSYYHVMSFYKVSESFMRLRYFQYPLKDPKPKTKDSDIFDDTSALSISRISDELFVLKRDRFPDLQFNSKNGTLLFIMPIILALVKEK